MVRRIAIGTPDTIVFYVLGADKAFGWWVFLGHRAES